MALHGFPGPSQDRWPCILIQLIEPGQQDDGVLLSRYLAEQDVICRIILVARVLLYRLFRTKLSCTYVACIWDFV